MIKVIEEAQRTPSLLNSQPWRIYVAEGEVAKAIRKDHEEKAGISKYFLITSGYLTKACAGIVLKPRLLAANINV